MFIAIVLVATMLLPLAACQAQCRSENLSVGLVQGLCFDGSNLPEWQRQNTHSQALLLHAPSRQPPTRGKKFQVFVEDARSPLAMGAVVINATVMHGAEQEHLAAGKQTGIVALYGSAALQKGSSSFLGKYLYSSLLKQDPRYYPSAGNRLPGRAFYAASRVFITHKDSGEKTLNTSYFLGLLTTKLLATAYRPYWARSNSLTVKTFGSGIGSDIGTDLLHEFGPGMRQLLKRHLPRFLRGQ